MWTIFFVSRLCSSLKHEELIFTVQKFSVASAKQCHQDGGY